MSTTAVIVELLMVGLFASVWLILFCLRLSLFDLSEIKNILSHGGDWATPLLFITVAILYPLGIFVNAFSEEITKHAVKGIKIKTFGHQVSYEEVRSAVYQNGSSELVQDIKLSFSFVRLARSGSINFTLIAISLFSFGGRKTLLGILSLIIGLCCIFLYRQLLVFYYLRLKIAHRIINEGGNSASRAT